MNEIPCHKAQIKKLNRIEGQVRAVKNMIEERRYCVDILSQLKAIRGAVLRVQKEVLQTHIKSCVKNAIDSKNPKDTDVKIQEILRVLGE